MLIVKLLMRMEKSKWITSELSGKHVHQIRSNYDGILVGSNTFFKDNPSLTAS